MTTHTTTTPKPCHNNCLYHTPARLWLGIGVLAGLGICGSVQATPVSWGFYGGLGVDQAQDIHQQRYTLQSTGDYTDLQSGRAGMGAHARLGYAWGTDEWFAGLETQYRIRQDRSAWLYFPSGNALTKLGEDARSQWDVSVRPGIRVSRGTHAFVRGGWAQTMGRLSYTDSVGAADRKNYRARGWLWGAGMESRLSPTISVVMEYHQLVSRRVTWPATDPWVVSATSGLAGLTNSADAIRITPHAHVFSVGFAWYFG